MTDWVLPVLRARDHEYGDGDGEEDRGPWLLAADGGRMTPERRLELAVSDLVLLDAVVAAAVRALAEPPTTPDPAVGVLLDEVGDLRQALHTMAVDPDRASDAAPPRGNWSRSWPGWCCC